MKRVIIFCAVLLFIAVSFSCNKYYYNEHGDLRPKKSKFQFATKNYQLPKSSNIDTNSVYVTEIQLPNGERYNSFIRFWGNGKVFINSYVPQLSKNETDVFNDLSTGDIGYFILQDNKLTIEVFGKYYSKHGDYAVITGETSSTEIVLTKEKLRMGGKRKLKEIYIKKKANLFSKPNW